MGFGPSQRVPKLVGHPRVPCALQPTSTHAHAHIKRDRLAEPYVAALDACGSKATIVDLSADYRERLGGQHLGGGQHLDRKRKGLKNLFSKTNPLHNDRLRHDMEVRAAGAGGERRPAVRSTSHILTL